MCCCITAIPYHFLITLVLYSSSRFIASPLSIYSVAVTRMENPIHLRVAWIRRQARAICLHCAIAQIVIVSSNHTYRSLFLQTFSTSTIILVRIMEVCRDQVCHAHLSWALRYQCSGLSITPISLPLLVLAIS